MFFFSFFFTILVSLRDEEKYNNEFSRFRGQERIGNVRTEIKVWPRSGGICVQPVIYTAVARIEVGIVRGREIHKRRGRTELLEG